MTEHCSTLQSVCLFERVEKDRERVEKGERWTIVCNVFVSHYSERCFLTCSFLNLKSFCLTTDLQLTIFSITSTSVLAA